MDVDGSHVLFVDSTNQRKGPRDCEVGLQEDDDPMLGLNVDTDLFSRELAETLQKRALAARMETHSICSVGTNNDAARSRTGHAHSREDFEKWYLIGQSRGCSSSAALGLAAAGRGCWQCP